MCRVMCISNDRGGSECRHGRIKLWRQSVGAACSVTESSVSARMGNTGNVKDYV